MSLSCVHGRLARSCEVCEAWNDHATACEQNETLRARIAELEAQCESAHAAQRHAETELAQYMAWYAMAEHQHLHEQRRAEIAEAEHYECARAEAERLRDAEAELHEIAGALPGVAYMDPPDGGSPSIAEQVRRMRADLDRTAAEVEQMRADAERYRVARRKVCIVGDSFHVINLRPTYVAPDAAIEFDAAIDAARAGGEG